jgi:hypothetical protein
MLYILSMQRVDILVWFLNDTLGVSAGAHSCRRIERSSREILPTHKAHVYVTVTLSTYTKIGRPRSGFYENEVSINYAAWCCVTQWLGVAYNLYILSSRHEWWGLWRSVQKYFSPRLFPISSGKTRLTVKANFLCNSVVLWKNHYMLQIFIRILYTMKSAFALWTPDKRCFIYSYWKRAVSITDRKIGVELIIPVLIDLRHMEISNIVKPPPHFKYWYYRLHLIRD